MIRNQEQVSRICVLADISSLHVMLCLFHILVVEIDYLAMNNEHHVRRNATYSTETKLSRVCVHYVSPLRF